MSDNTPTPTPAPERTDAIPVALKKLRLTSMLKIELTRYIVSEARHRAHKRVYAERVALGHDVWIEACGGEVRADIIESLPDGWMQRVDQINTHIPNPKHQSIYMHLPLVPVRAIPAIHRHTAYIPESSVLRERIIAQNSEQARIDKWSTALSHAMADALPSCRNVYALLTLPGVPEYVTPSLISWCMEKVRPDTPPARTFENVAAVCAQFDNLPPVPADSDPQE